MPGDTWLAIIDGWQIGNFAIGWGLGRLMVAFAFIKAFCHSFTSKFHFLSINFPTSYQLVFYFYYILRMKCIRFLYSFIPRCCFHEHVSGLSSGTENTQGSQEIGEHFDQWLGACTRGLNIDKLTSISSVLLSHLPSMVCSWTRANSVSWNMFIYMWQRSTSSTASSLSHNMRTKPT